MLPSRPVASSWCRLLLAVGFPFLLISCSLAVKVKDYPARKPFVYKTQIQVNGPLSSEEKEDLASKLKNQLDDSLRARSVSKVLWSVMRRPPVYDSLNALRSVEFMRALLRSLGYFRDTIRFSTRIDTVGGDQYRTQITFQVTPGKQVHIDTFSYNLSDSNLQQLALQEQNKGMIREGDPFAKGAISLELDRLVEEFRNNGYMRFSREGLIGLWDTLDISLLRPTFDPLEQLAILQKLRERRENPTASLEIKLRPGYDTGRLKPYYVGQVTLYPDVNFDTLPSQRRETWVRGIRVVDYQRLFKPKIFPENIYLKRGALYDQRNYIRTINRFNLLGSWRLVSIDTIMRPGQDTTDFAIRLTPAKKYSFSANLEASQNQNISVVSSNLFGLGVNAGVQNRNFLRAANQTIFNLRYGVELGNTLVQTQQASLSYNIFFPRLLPRPGFIPNRIRANTRTVFSLNAATTLRRRLFDLQTFNTSWGFDYQRVLPERNRLIQVLWKIPNIELSLLNPKDSLINLINNNPVIRNIFTDGLIVSSSLGITVKNTREQRPNLFAVNLEVPFMAFLMRGRFLDTQLYRFIKVSTEFTQLFKRKKTAWVLRGFAGIGYALNSTVNPDKRNTLPFFRQFFAGGPNSMRAWRLRRLGPGSTIKDFGQFPDRLGDLQLEFNSEYRFLLGKIAGTRVESVLFTDIGNVWLLKKNAGDPEEVFNFSRLGRDLAIGLGTGLRVDFSFFLIRVDYAYKVKDPSPGLADAASQNKWFYNWKPFNGTLQIGINYPFSL